MAVHMDESAKKFVCEAESCSKRFRRFAALLDDMPAFLRIDQNQQAAASTASTLTDQLVLQRHFNNMTAFLRANRNQQAAISTVSTVNDQLVSQRHFTFLYGM